MHDEYSHDELQSGCDVLHETHPRQWNLRRGKTEQQQWDSGHWTESDEQDRAENVVCTKIQGSRRSLHRDQDDGDGHQPDGLERETLRRVEHSTDAILDESIDSERARKDKCQPRDLPVPDDEYRDGDGGQNHRDPVERSKFFAQHHDTEKDRDERVDEISERALDDATGQVSDDVELPIDINQDARGNRV